MADPPIKDDPLTPDQAIGLLRRMREQVMTLIQRHPNTELRFAIAKQTGAAEIPMEGDPGRRRKGWEDLFVNRTECWKHLMLQETGPEKAEASGTRLIWSAHTCWWAMYRSVTNRGGILDDENRRSHAALAEFMPCIERMTNAYAGLLISGFEWAPKPWWIGPQGWLSVVAQIGVQRRDALFKTGTTYVLDVPELNGGAPNVADFLESWDELAHPPPPGVYLLAPMVDARRSSLETIDVLLELAGAPAENPGTMIGPALVDARTEALKSVRFKQTKDTPEDVVLGPDHTRPPIVRGHEGRLLTPETYRVARALIEAGDGGLDCNAVESLLPSARRIIRNLAREWGPEIVVRPGKRGAGRYRIRGTIRDG